jgi:transcriptional regulator of met regulon
MVLNEQGKKGAVGNKQLVDYNKPMEQKQNIEAVNNIKPFKRSPEHAKLNAAEQVQKITTMIYALRDELKVLEAVNDLTGNQDVQIEHVKETLNVLQDQFVEVLTGRPINREKTMPLFEDLSEPSEEMDDTPMPSFDNLADFPTDIPNLSDNYEEID